VIGRFEIVEHALGGAVAGVAHEVGELGLVIGPGGQQAAAERVAEEFVRVQPGVVRGSLLDEGRHGLVGQFFRR
jgi:hypothetical protein